MTRRTKLTLGFVAILALVVIVVTSLSLRASRLANDYERARACASGENLNAPCRQTLPATVERLYTEGTGRRQILLMQARLTAGSILKTQIPSSNFWQSLEQGNPIAVEIWNGHVMRVRAMGRDEPTSENPTWRFSNARNGLIAISVMLVLMTVMIVLALRFGRRRKQIAH